MGFADREAEQNRRPKLICVCAAVQFNRTTSLTFDSWGRFVILKSLEQITVYGFLKSSFLAEPSIVAWLERRSQLRQVPFSSA